MEDVFIGSTVLCLKTLAKNAWKDPMAFTNQVDYPWPALFGDESGNRVSPRWWVWGWYYLTSAKWNLTFNILLPGLALGFGSTPLLDIYRKKWCVLWSDYCRNPLLRTQSVAEWHLFLLAEWHLFLLTLMRWVWICSNVYPLSTLWSTFPLLW